MAIASVVVVPASSKIEKALISKLEMVEGVGVKGTVKGGIAVVMEADGMGSLNDLSREINSWEEVVEFNVAYLNWEDLAGNA